jgi:hypothetical protein
VPEDRARDLPTVECVAQPLILDFEGQLINILRRQIVPDVVIAGAVIACQFSR